VPPISPMVLVPHWYTKDGRTVRYYAGDAARVTSRLPKKSVHCAVTSPPYWGMRDYGVEGQIGAEKVVDCEMHRRYRGIDHWCGECYVCHIVLACSGVWRVLRDDGTFWLNLGDGYGGGNGNTLGSEFVGTSNKKRLLSKSYDDQKRPISNLAAGNLVGAPWRVALALQADGWVLRQEVIWYKPSPMPESITNRCTKAHEHLFMFSKGKSYFFDQEAIKEPQARSSIVRAKGGVSGLHKNIHGAPGQPPHRGLVNVPREPDQDRIVPAMSNKRSVWTVDDEAALANWLSERDPALLAQFLGEAKGKGSVWKVAAGKGYAGAHFATYPPGLIRPCIRAGTSAYGCCVECAAPFRRIVEKRQVARSRPNEYVKRTGESGTGNACNNTVAGVESITLGWSPTCTCDGMLRIGDCPTEPSKKPNETEAKWETRVGKRWRKARDMWELTWSNVKYQYADLPTNPCIVLDPFVGSGTTAEVCIEEGRYCWGIDLSAEYLDLHAIPRVEGVLRDRGSYHLLDSPEPPAIVGEIDG
jgi:DNA modification methylase